MIDLLTTQEAADKLNVSRKTVQALIASKQLPAMRAGRDWLIAASDIEKVRVRRPVGRPRKRVLD